MKRETLDRVKTDFPLIYFSTIAGSITTYLISIKKEDTIDFWYMLGLMITSLTALGLVYFCYWIIYVTTQDFKN